MRPISAAIRVPLTPSLAWPPHKIAGDFCLEKPLRAQDSQSYSSACRVRFFGNDSEVAIIAGAVCIRAGRLEHEQVPNVNT